MWNRYLVIGGALVLLGIVLLPVIIGLPILAVGTGLFTIGVMVRIAYMFPGGKRLVYEYEQMGRRMWEFLKAIIIS